MKLLMQKRWTPFTKTVMNMDLMAKPGGSQAFGLIEESVFWLRLDCRCFYRRGVAWFQEQTVAFYERPNCGESDGQPICLIPRNQIAEGRSKHPLKNPLAADETVIAGIFLCVCSLDVGIELLGRLPLKKYDFTLCSRIAAKKEAWEAG